MPPRHGLCAFERDPVGGVDAGEIRLDAQAPGVGDQLFEDVGDDAAHEVVHVVQGVARFVEDLGSLEAQFVGLPERVDELGRSTLAQTLAQRRVRRARFVEQTGDGAKLEQHRPAGGLGGVGGEDGAHVQGGDGRGHLLGGDRSALDGRQDLVGDPGQGPVVVVATLAALAGPVRLLGHVGEVEVDGEGAYQLAGGREVQAVELGEGQRHVAAGARPHRLDEGQEVGGFLAGQGIVEHRAEVAQVAREGVEVLEV